MEKRDPKLRSIWKQKEIPVLFRRSRPLPLLVKLPYARNNFAWLRGERRNKPNWNAQYKAWEVPIAWFDDLIKQLLDRYSKSYVIQLYREQQKCAPACWNAKGLHCECSCMGANHGTGAPGGSWYEVSETFAFSWGEQEYACRLMIASRDEKA
jgi:hypothetical protein